MNSSIDGITSQRIPSAKSATFAVSLVSLYNHVIESILTMGMETNNAPNTVVFLAISLAATTIVPLRMPLPIHVSQVMYTQILLRFSVIT